LTWYFSVDTGESTVLPQEISAKL